MRLINWVFLEPYELMTTEQYTDEKLVVVPKRLVEIGLFAINQMVTLYEQCSTYVILVWCVYSNNCCSAHHELEEQGHESALYDYYPTCEDLIRVSLFVTHSFEFIILF